MAKLYQHKTNGTYYTKVYRGGMVTLQIHPLGVSLLQASGCRVGDEIEPDVMRQLSGRDWLFTKEEMHGLGLVDWAPIDMGPSTSMGSSQRPGDAVVPLSDIVRRFGAWALSLAQILDEDHAREARNELEHSARRLRRIARKMDAPDLSSYHFWIGFQTLKIALYDAIESMSAAGLEALREAVQQIPPMPAQADEYSRRHETRQVLEQFLKLLDDMIAARGGDARSQPRTSFTFKRFSKGAAVPDRIDAQFSARLPAPQDRPQATRSSGELPSSSGQSPVIVAGREGNEQSDSRGDVPGYKSPSLPPTATEHAHCTTAAARPATSAARTSVALQTPGRQIDSPAAKPARREYDTKRTWWVIIGVALLIIALALAG